MAKVLEKDYDRLMKKIPGVRFEKPVITAWAYETEDEVDDKMVAMVSVQVTKLFDNGISLDMEASDDYDAKASSAYTALELCLTSDAYFEKDGSRILSEDYGEAEKKELFEDATWLASIRIKERLDEMGFKGTFIVRYADETDHALVFDIE
jgi:hypothetical protein